MPRKNSQSVERQRSLGFFLQCNGETESTAWSCHASAELRMLKWDPDQEPCKRSEFICFNCYVFSFFFAYF